jgi:membrane protease YdiL (CAAX protease family)
VAPQTPRGHRPGGAGWCACVAFAAAHMTGAGLSITVLVNARMAAVLGGRARWPGGREV